MRPTRRAVVLFMVGVPASVVLVIATPDLWAFALAIVGGAALLVGLDAVLVLPKRRLFCEVHTPPVLYVGDADDLIIDFPATRWSYPARVEVLCDVGGSVLRPPPLSADALPDAPTELAVPLVAERRGTVSIDRLWLRWSGPFSLMAQQRTDALEREIAVLPNVRAVRSAALTFESRNAFIGLKVQSMHGEGSDFNSLRDYVAGLDHRWIDWKHSARHRRLVCKEFQAEANHNVILAVDTGQLMSEPLDGIPRLDHAVNSGLVLAYMALRTGDRVGVFGFDANVRLYADPIAGVQAFHRVQQASARLDYHREETNFTLGLANLSARLARRSLVILFTEFVDTVTAELLIENVQRLVSRHLVLFVTFQDSGLSALADAPPRRFDDIARAVVADEFIRDRLVVFERLRRLGVLCLDAPTGPVGIDLVNRYLAVKRREMI